MELKYYVLGKKNNPILSLYLDKYYDLLQKKLTDISLAGFLVTEISQLLAYTENRKFILNADISSLINVLHLEIVEKKSQGLQSADFYIDKLQKEITFLISEDHEKLTMNQ